MQIFHKQFLVVCRSARRSNPSSPTHIRRVKFPKVGPTITLLIGITADIYFILLAEFQMTEIVPMRSLQQSSHIRKGGLRHLVPDPELEFCEECQTNKHQNPNRERPTRFFNSRSPQRFFGQVTSHVEQLIRTLWTAS